MDESDASYYISNEKKIEQKYPNGAQQQNIQK
jgi:hypothetical protein